MPKRVGPGGEVLAVSPASEWPGIVVASSGCRGRVVVRIGGATPGTSVRFELWLLSLRMAPGKRSVMPVAGRWRIVEMDLWDRDAIDLVEPGFIEFTKNRTGQFGFAAVRGWMDCRAVNHDGRTRVEFSWKGHDDGDQTSGRGWAALVDDTTVEGHLFIHLGEDSGFRAKPLARADRWDEA